MAQSLVFIGISLALVIFCKLSFFGIIVVLESSVLLNLNSLFKKMRKETLPATESTLTVDVVDMIPVQNTNNNVVNINFDNVANNVLAHLLLNKSTPPEDEDLILRSDVSKSPSDHKRYSELNRDLAKMELNKDLANMKF